ncbi:MAG TPA: hypothetical protein VJ805_04450 [Nitrospiraceae bacterium]|nr:hypothetical protein [Nitrospiraceae bacterium]
MEFYWVLSASMAIIAVLAWLLFVRTGSFAFPLGVLFLYFWSLHGAWSIVADGLGEGTEKHHHYLYEKIFPIELNDDYLWTLILYACFIVVIELTVLWKAESCLAVTVPTPPVYISHGSLLLVSVIAAFSSYAIVKDQLATAILLGKSGYSVTRGGLGELVPLFTLHQVLNRVALFSLAIGLAVFVVGRKGKWLVGETSAPIAVAYGIALSILFVYLTILGNKNELFSALILSGMFYSVNSNVIRPAMLGGVSILAVAGIGLVDFLRAFPVTALWEEVDWWEALQWAPEIRGSNEAFGAHFSLYGTLHFHAPLTYGSSLVSLLASVIPRIVWPERPGDIYAHYVDSVGIAGGIGEQGFTIHHAAGWYLNFGLPGLFAGAVILGLVWAQCFNFYRRLERNGSSSRWWYMFAVLAPCGFLASVPPLIRAGPEGYKGVLIEGLLVPATVMLLASYGHDLFRRTAPGLFPVQGRLP